ncbi:BTAD domain-containing putative transcriptional regulator [Nocardioides panzhihuensis]|uniref:DNA-binding SARP family transcriptional activator/tetratricopeptide (TPR) repeat protein/DNA-binding XRE family transcriptional regulator n=1 Tax=Nocardioides panzhihuensis TaxID=860243 RepID=A0A7Z0ITP2_9ACTN|nr:DNA-binding SARP family transcriptional activator/tetratricopeptide (TPR) repeat protein/DNA-binding XRE family transcriptional regulator [Nocardioides panzhihuensis]
MRLEGLLGIRLRLLREERSLTQGALAEAAGVSVASIRDLEQGRTRRPRAASLRALARALDLTPEEAAEFTEAPAPSRDAEDSAVVSVSVLGPTLVVRDGVALDLPEQVGLLLRRLALDPGEKVGRDELLDLLWPELTSDAAGKRMAQLLRRLRALVAPITVTHDGNALGLDATPEELDLVRFRELAADADLDTLTEAVRLWRGRPDRFEEAPWLSSSVENEYVAVALRWAGLSVAEGQAIEALPVVSELARLRPLDEPLWAAYVKVLAAAGRQAEALAAYETVRSVLAEELGLDPSPVLEDVRQGTLEGRWHARRPTLVEGARRRDVPREVPAAPALIGREAELATLTAGLGEDGGAAVLVTGPAGSGKSTLALTAAARLTDDFPDGQLYADLHGVSGEAVAPGLVLRRFLRSLGLSGQQIPTDDADAAALLRSELSDRRMLIVLDSVDSPGQVVPLLPGLGESRTILTSRHRLPALAGMIDLGRQIHLGELSIEASVALVGAIVGAERVAAAPRASESLALACGRLPLALRIAAARLLSRPEWSIETYADRLSASSHRLAELAVGEVSVAASLEISYSAMPAEVQRAFRLCSLISAYDFDPAPAGAVLARDPETAQRLLEDLVDANMLQTVVSEDGVGRYHYHDLLRLHAGDLAAADLEQQEAQGRLADWLLDTTVSAADTTYPGRLRALEIEPSPGSRFDSADDARTWLDHEAQLLIAFVKQAGADPQQRHYAWKLVDQSRIHYRTRLDVTTYLDLMTVGAEAAMLEGEVRAEAFLRTLRVDVLGVLGRMDEAWAESDRARTLLDTSGWRKGQAFAAIVDGHRHRVADSGREAESAYARALEILGEAPGTEGLRAWAHQALGIACTQQGRFEEGRRHHLVAVELSEVQGSATPLELSTLAAAERALGLLDSASARLESALAQATRNRSPFAEANALEELSLLALVRGDHASALELADRAHLTARAHGDVRFVASTACSYAAALYATGSLRDAAETYEYAVRLSHTHVASFTETRARVGLAQALHAEGDHEAARTHAAKGRQLAVEHGFAPLRHEADRALELLGD